MDGLAVARKTHHAFGDELLADFPEPFDPLLVPTGWLTFALIFGALRRNEVPDTVTLVRPF